MMPNIRSIVGTEAPEMQKTRPVCANLTTSDAKQREGMDTERAERTTLGLSRLHDIVLFSIIMSLLSTFSAKMSRQKSQKKQNSYKCLYCQGLQKNIFWC